MLDTDMPTYEKGSVLALTPPEDEFDPFWLCHVESTVTAELTDPNIEDIDLPITFLEVVVGDDYERGETTTTPFDSVISVVRKAGAELGATFKLSAKERSAIGEQQEKCAQECAADGQGLDEGKLMATFPVAESTEQLTVARPSATAIKGVEAAASNAGADQEPCVQCDRCGKWRALAGVTPLPDKWRAGSDGAEDAPAPALSFEEAEQLLLLPETTASWYGERSVEEIPGFHYDGSNGQQPFHGIFFEPELPIRRPSMAYKWITSGGLKGSTVWPHDHLKARVRRRYGRVTERPKKGEPAVPGGQVAEGGFVIPPLPALFFM